MNGQSTNIERETPMVYFYRMTNLSTGKVYDNQKTDIDEFSSYRDFIANIEALNQIFAGEYKWEESCLTSQYEMV